MLSRHRTASGDAAGAPKSPGLAAGRRTLVLLTLVALVGTPAGVLRAFCVGHSCDEPVNASGEVPFCSLPDGVRARVAAGFREGRSPDLLAVTASESLVASDEWPPVPWPSPSNDTRVPIAFWGTGVDAGAEIPPGTGVDDIAPTIEAMLGFARPHPDVRSGTAIEGVASGTPPRLVVEIVWIGRGSADVARAAALEEVMASGTSTLEGDTASVPVDPAAVLTTIGTGGRPAQHGITATIVRDESGELRRAWGPNAPVHVIATLADDLDEELRQEPVIGMVGARRSYRGAVAGDWYVDVDRDRFVKTERGREARDALSLLDSSFGDDDVPDLAVVAVESGPERLAATMRAVTRRAQKVSRGSAAFVFTATG
ncbi:MAG: hypothetical protein M3271_02250, partial [Actinomycetota bacterium]|nr:hypothetical protein [Actinomycetota bacterium]